MHINFPRLSTQSDPDLQTARFQGRNSGNGCSAAHFLRRNTNLESGTASTFILCAAITKYNYESASVLKQIFLIKSKLEEIFL